MRVALTGTPGVGKTTLAQAARASGWRVVDVKAWAKQEGCVVAYDEDDDADVLDVLELAALVPPDDGTKVIYEGHVSHFLGLDQIWVLRLDPRVLADRLRARGYRKEKVAENLEAEALDLIFQEALDVGAPVIQRDATHRSASDLLAAFERIGAGRNGSNDVEPVDWSDQLPIEVT